MGVEKEERSEASWVWLQVPTILGLKISQKDDRKRSTRQLVRVGQVRQKGRNIEEKDCQDSQEQIKIVWVICLEQSAVENQQFIRVSRQVTSGSLVISLKRGYSKSICQYPVENSEQRWQIYWKVYNGWNRCGQKGTDL